MTIAGSDSGAGAGIQAALKTFAALGVYGTSVVTAITAQNTQAVLAIAEVPDEVVALQIDAVLEDIGADAIQTGMLSSPSIVATVADRLEAWGIPALVVDPVMVAKSGDTLLQPAAVLELQRSLLPLAMVVTPNIPEAVVLSGRPAGTLAEMRDAARAIADLGPKYVIIKGGHREGEPVDLIFDGTEFSELFATRIATRNDHGTGDTLSAAIAAHLAHGLSPMAAIAAAKEYLTEALRESYAVGEGRSPVNHFHRVQIPAIGALR